MGGTSPAKGYDTMRLMHANKGYAAYCLEEVGIVAH